MYCVLGAVLQRTSHGTCAAGDSLSGSFLREGQIRQPVGAIEGAAFQRNCLVMQGSCVVSSLPS